MPQATWKKSSYSNGQANCVEVCTGLPEMIAVRDSKNPGGGHLTVSAAGWRAFLNGVKRGDYRDPA
jgi:hypothetical protein